MSLRKAIDGKCRECIYDPLAAGSWLKQVEECVSTDCSLYPTRPLTTLGKVERSRQNALKKRDKGRFTSEQ